MDSTTTAATTTTTGNDVAAASSTTTTTALDSIVRSQLESLSDTDPHASAWSNALRSAALTSTPASWGGRGKGGRGLARRTYQPTDVVVEGVTLEYINDAGAGKGSGKALLRDATLKLLGGKVYALVGRNGCGKSTLLRRIESGSIPGFPSHLAVVSVPQEVLPVSWADDDDDGGEEDHRAPPPTPLTLLLERRRSHAAKSDESDRVRIEELEKELEALDVSDESNAETVERLCDEISSLEDNRRNDDEDDGGPGGEEWTEGVARRGAAEALDNFGIDATLHDVPMTKLSGGQRKKVDLACAMFCRPDLLLLDEPTNHLDVAGIVQLRRLITSTAESGRTVLLVSHDVDLIDDVPTDVIHFHSETLSYYPGTYRDFLGYKDQIDCAAVRKGRALEKQRGKLLESIGNMKKQSAGRRGNAEKKKRKAIDSKRKKLERIGVEKDKDGHRWTAQKAGTGIREGSINGVDASARNKLTHAQILKRRHETKVSPVPDKAVQFEFRNTTCTWGEPLLMALDVGHGFGTPPLQGSSGSGGAERGDLARRAGASPGPDTAAAVVPIVKKDGFLFDCVDLCVDEGSRTCILGKNGGGKSTLLRILAGRIRPLEGSVRRAHNVNVGFFDQHVVDDLIESCSPRPGGGGTVVTTPLSLLTGLFPTKTEQELRGELTSFGLSPKQAGTNVRFLSGGERCRLCLAVLMLRDPHVLLLDEPTNHLDPESVEALSYGLSKWNGTVVLVSHDANLVRSVGGECYVLMEGEGKLRRIPNGIDSYLKAFTL